MPASHATHPTAEQLAAFAAGRLANAQAQVVAAHLQRCPTCCQAAGEASGGAPSTRAPAGRTPPPAGVGVLAPRVALPDLPPELAKHPRYRILKELGRGGMGVVYQAEQTLMDRPVAIKVIGRELLSHPDALERFRREIKAAARLTHPNIVIAHDAEEVGDLHILVMEYVQGQSLAEVLRRKGPLSVAHACHFARQAALGLQYALEKGMVHRDIKPQNLMMTPKGQVKILDFGLAKVVSEAGAGQSLTASGAYMGTPEYCAPEQAADARQADIRADIYSLGCTLYALLAGKPPFQEDTAVLTILAHLSKEVPPLPKVRPDVPPELWAVIERMLAKDPAGRHPKPAEVAQALLPYCRGGAEARVAPIPLQAEERPEAGRIRLPIAKGRQGVGEVRAAPAPAAGETSPGNRQATRKSRNPSRTAIEAAKRRRWWLIGGGAAALLALATGVWLVAGIVLKVKTQQGVVVLDIDPPDAEVSVDGRRWTVKLAGDQEPLLIELPEGRHELKVTRGGFETFTKEFTLRAGKSQRVVARLLPEKGLTPAPDQSPPASEKTKDNVAGIPRPALLDCTEPNGLAATEVRRAQEAWAKYLGRQVEETVDVGNSVRMTFVLIPPGKFRMGSPANEMYRNADETLHTVTLTGPFDMAKTEVTQRQYLALTGKDPSQFRGGELPVEQVSWKEATDYADRLAKQRTDNYLYRLPTEAEWEYACRAGTTTAYYTGNEQTRKRAGWCTYNGEPGSATATKPVAQFEPNAWGLYDMHGNVWEWCADRYGPYPGSGVTNPTGPEKGSGWIIRGGCFRAYPGQHRAANRGHFAKPYENLGFRLARSLASGGK
jgi:formylglycine-generating enzyme required for sulfatase activity